MSRRVELVHAVAILLAALGLYVQVAHGAVPVRFSPDCWYDLQTGRIVICGADPVSSPRPSYGPIPLYP